MNLFFLNSGILTVVYIEHCVEIFFYTICILYYEVSNYVEQAFDAVKCYIPVFDWAWLQKAWRVGALILFAMPGFIRASSFQVLHL